MRRSLNSGQFWTYEKASAESAVQVVERWLMARLRHTVLADVNAADTALAALLPSLNERRFQKLEGSRASLFAALDAPTLSALPAQRWLRLARQQARRRPGR